MSASTVDTARAVLWAALLYQAKRYWGDLFVFGVDVTKNEITSSTTNKTPQTGPHLARCRSTVWPFILVAPFQPQALSP